MTNQVWVADDDQSIAWVIEKTLSKNGIDVSTFTDGSHLIEALASRQPDLVISDIKMPELGGFDLLQEINNIYANLPVIIMTAYGDLDSAVNSFKHGAYEYLTKPFDVNELLTLVSRCLENPTQVDNRSNHNINLVRATKLLGESSAMQEVFRIIGRISRTSMGVLIRGESGTGKELVANALFENSERNNSPYIAINTAAIPSELLESELFGHEKGAFTGAHNRHTGRFEQANKGTLFLDEIGDMPLALQTRLLRVLSEGRFYRVGGREEINVDVRVIAATNQNLEKLVADGRFRNDLFHRLNVLSLNIPALRNRIEDIPQLAEHFLSRSALKNNIPLKELGDGVLNCLQQYHWPGNIRELENVIQQTSILSAGERIELIDLPSVLLSTHNHLSEASWQNGLLSDAQHRLRIGEQNIVRSLGSQFEKILIDAALQHTHGRKQKAATLLGWGRNTLTRKMQ